MVIEDNPDYTTIISHAIQHNIPEVKTVLLSNEAETLAYLNECTALEWELPRLILLDLYLPDRQSGWRVLDMIRSLPAALGKIPVIMLSGSESQGDIAEAYRRGCSSYLVKPTESSDWQHYFQCLRTYWWQTVTLPKNGFSVF